MVLQEVAEAAVRVKWKGEEQSGSTEVKGEREGGREGGRGKCLGITKKTINGRESQKDTPPVIN